MVHNIESILLGSNNATKLAEFYKKKVGLKVTMEAEMGKGQSVFAFSFKNGSDFVIMDHNKIKGKNTSPERYMLNFEVDNIEKEVARLKKEKVTLVQDVYHIENYGYIATFEDIDGNYFQLVKTKA